MQSLMVRRLPESKDKIKAMAATAANIVVFQEEKPVCVTHRYQDTVGSQHIRRETIDVYS